MKQPIPKPKPALMAPLKRSSTYRSAAFTTAVVGSLLLYFGLAEQSLWAFVGFIIMFIGAASAIVVVILGIRDKNVHAIMLGLALLMWLVLLPLVLLSRQFPHTAGDVPSGASPVLAHVVMYEAAS